jgi:drug/metabolite transporter (DMT)-like permease
MGSEVLILFCGLASAMSFGAGDFCGGLATKRNSVFGVIVISQLFGLALLFFLAVTLAAPIPTSAHLIIGGLAGIVGTLGLAALYSGLARGNMGIVAPVSAVVAAAVPVIVGILNEGLPSNWQLAGLVVALCAIWFLAGGGSDTSVQVRELGLPIAAGLAFGLFFILIDQVSTSAILWPLVAARVSSIVLLSIFITIRGSGKMPAWNQLAIIVLAGIFDAGGNMLFALATRLGRLDISAILASLYPAGTVLLAWFILKERLTLRQWVGVVTALAALVLIAA